MARLIDRHDVGARPDPAAPLDQVGQRLINQGLKLPSLAARKVAYGGQNLRIHPGSEFLSTAGHHKTPNLGPLTPPNAARAPQTLRAGLS